MLFFNMVVYGLVELYFYEYVCFVIFYLYEVINIKVVVVDMNIGC